MARWKAAAIHLCISVVIAGIASGLLLGVWYPPPYFRAAGAGNLLALIVGVDVGIGPLLTLLVFKPGKRGLKLDLAIIAILQTAALVYGFHTIVRSRPVFMVAAVDRFVLVDADQISGPDLQKAAQPQWRRLSWTGPVLVAAEVPTDPVKRNNLLFKAVSENKDVQDFPEYYVPYHKAAQHLLEQAHPVSALIALNPHRQGMIGTWLKHHHRDASHVVWLPVETRKHDLAMMMDATSGQPLAALPLIPWAADELKPAAQQKNENESPAPGHASSTASR